MNWTRENPGAGEPQAIRHAAQARANLAGALTGDALPRIDDVAKESHSAWAGNVAAAFVAQAEGLVPQVQSLVERLERESAALSAYAGEVEEIEAIARSLRARQAVTASELASAHRLLSELQLSPGDELMDARRRSTLEQRLHDATTQQRKHEAEWDELSDRRRAADESCLDATQLPPGTMTTLTARALRNLSDAGFLAALETMSPSQLLAALRTDPKLADRLSQVTDAQATAAWWRSLGTEPFDPADQSAAQLSLVSAIPTALGNLEGISYWARDEANRDVLAQRIAAVNKLKAKVTADWNPWTPTASLELAAAGFSSLDDFNHYRDSLLTLRRTLTSAGDVPRQLVNFEDVDLRHSPGSYDPLAAISVGDLDRAQRVTVDVPGITSTVLSSSRDWSAAAQNLYYQEQRVSQIYQQPTSIAVVAWLGYHTPGAGDMAALWSTHDAQAGSAQLVSFLKGTTAAHNWAPGANLSVVAHSYGATTAALAVSQTPVANFTMLAPAGLAPSDATVSDLQVPADHVWSTEASGDLLADVGRSPFYSQHPVDVTSASFGGHQFSAQNATLNGVVYHGSDGHDSQPHTAAILDHKHGSDLTNAHYGYLDAKTTPLYNTALASVGITDQNAYLT